MSRQAFFLPGQPADAWPYSECLRVGDWVFVAGQGPIDAATQEAVLGSIEEETRLVFDHIRELLALADCGLEDVVKVTVHLADINDFDRYNAVYREYFNHRPLPTRITVQSVLWGGIKIEAEVQAYQPSGR